MVAEAMSHTQIKRIISELPNGKVWITTIEFEDGGEVMRATGVGKGFTVGTPIITFMDDRYNKCKFTLDSPAQQPTPESNT